MGEIERRAAVERARELWIRKLIDLSRRNNLLYFREQRAGMLDLSGSDPALVEALLTGESIALSRLLPQADDGATLAKAREIRRRSVANLEERGIETLFLAIGMATWAPADDGRPPAAAVLLLPMAIESRGREGQTFALRRTGEAQVNLVLLHVLEAEFGVRVTPEWLLEDRADEESFDFTAVFSRLLEEARRIKGFAVQPRFVLSNFSFQKMAMVKDLRERAEELAQHDVIAAIAGDPDARQGATSGREPVDPASFDAQPPQQEFLVLDADSSQQQVVAAVARGQHGVIQGPPGTGKSQTIANLITTLAAEGRRVLFVAEKRAALEVVLRRLQVVGLGHLALDLHGADISRRDIVRRLAENLTLVRDAAAVDAAELHRRFEDRRARLVAHRARMHAPLAPSGLSMYELQGRVLALPAGLTSATRWRGPALAALSPESIDAMRSLLAEASTQASLFLHTDPSPWARAALNAGPDVHHAVETAGRLLQHHLPGLRRALGQLCALTGLPLPTTVESAQDLLALLAAVSATLASYRPALFEHDLEQLAADLALGGEGVLSRALAWGLKPPYRRAQALARALRAAGPVPLGQLRAELQEAAAQQRAWQRLQLSGQEPDAQSVGAVREPPLPGYGAEPDGVKAAQPVAVPGVEPLQGALGGLLADLDALGRYLAREDLRRLPLDDLERLLAALAADELSPYRVLRLREIEREIERRGGAPLLAELRASRPAPSQWPLLLEHAWLHSCLEQARAEHPTYVTFDGRVHDEVAGEFRALDQQRVRLASARVRRTHAERVIQVMNAHPEQAALVRREAEKKSRHLPLRKLLAQAPEVLTTLCPCWMASPLSISQLLGAEQRYFDVVVFDEASQVLPEDAIAALLRGSRVVVAGDKHQLPPTLFFAAGEDEEQEAEEGAAEGFQSLLDLMASFLSPWPLTWHYRSRDEALIAFSNRHIYDDRLITFPGPGGGQALSHVLVEQVPGLDGQEESSSEEVRRVVELIVEHATARPDETLGVIAMGIRHANRLEAALEQVLRGRPDLDPFFNQSKDERFFIKNLERVQGDERDAIILSIGYGKDRAGKLPYRFGPLLTEGGERRLNVAITRARCRMTVVSSFSHHDMDPGRSKARGVELLRLYLQYAASHGQLAGDRLARGAPPPNAFEADVAAALQERGVPLLPQWGASHYRIDFAAQHPTRPGRLVLAVECDGATYHATPTARERDRLRQEHLEALGWRFHRIWSTDWFLRREAEIARALEAYQRAVALADAADLAAAAPLPAAEAAPDTPAMDQAALPATGPTIHLRPADAGLAPIAPPTAAGGAPPAGQQPAPGGLRSRIASATARMAAQQTAPPARQGQPAIASAEDTPQDQPHAYDAAAEQAAALESAGLQLPGQREPRPPVPLRESIDEYRRGELLALLRWIQSDGRLRTDDEIVTEMVRELGFRRRGVRIEEAVRLALQHLRSIASRR